MIDTKKLREAIEVYTVTPLITDFITLLDELDRVTEEHGLAMSTLESRDRNIEAMSEEYRRLKAENEALKKDAERYRYLIATCNIEYEPSEPWQLVIWEPNTGEDWKTKLDAAIDDAIRVSKGEA